MAFYLKYLCCLIGSENLAGMRSKNERIFAQSAAFDGDGGSPSVWQFVGMVRCISAMRCAMRRHTCSSNKSDLLIGLPFVYS